MIYFTFNIASPKNECTFYCSIKAREREFCGDDELDRPIILIANGISYDGRSLMESETSHYRCERHQLGRSPIISGLTADLDLLCPSNSLTNILSVILSQLDSSHQNIEQEML